MKTKFRVRRKGTRADGSYRYIIEKIRGGKILGSIALPKAQVLWGMMCPG